MKLIGKWFDSQGHILIIETFDNHMITGDFSFNTRKGLKTIPIEGVVVPCGRREFSLIFFINWGRYIQTIDGYTRFRTQLKDDPMSISFDIHWTKCLRWPKGNQLERGISRFCLFDFEHLKPVRQSLHPHPFEINEQSAMVGLRN